MIQTRRMMHTPKSLPRRTELQDVMAVSDTTRDDADELHDYHHDSLLSHFIRSLLLMCISSGPWARGLL